MSRLMMGLHLFLILMFFTGVKTEEANRCMEMMKFQEEFGSIIKLAGPERFNLFCANMTSFFTCINNVIIEKTGMNVKQLANHWLIKGTEQVKFLNVVVQMEEFVEEICTEGTQLHEEYMVDNKCFTNSSSQAAQVTRCKDQAIDAYKIFKELRTENGIGEQTDECVITAYQLGCIGATLHEACGEEAFNRYKNVMKRIGFFRSGICSPDVMETLKTTFLQSLDMSDSRRILYRSILDLKKRRK